MSLFTGGGVDGGTEWMNLWPVFHYVGVFGLFAAIHMTLGGITVLQSAAVITGPRSAFVCMFATTGLIREFATDSEWLLYQEDSRLYDSPPKSHPDATQISDDD